VSARRRPAEASAAPGVVRVRLSGEPADVAVLQETIALLARGAARLPYGIEVLEQSAPRPNRYDPGERVYVTLRIRE
jgi:hypothetical protein